MKFILIYYAQLAGPKVEGELAKFTETDEIADWAKRVKKSDDTSMFLREAEAFDGQVEVHGGELPHLVVLVGDSAAMDAVREAYDAVDIHVGSAEVGDEELPFPAGVEPEDDEDPFDGNINLLKERATELGISFSPTIGYNNLLSRVRGVEKKKEESGD